MSLELKRQILVRLQVRHLTFETRVDGDLSVQIAFDASQSEPLQQLLLTHSNFARQQGFHGELGLELMSRGPADGGVPGAGG